MDLFSHNELAALMNEWQRRFIETPEAYEAEFRTIIQFLDEESEGVEPSYGKDCVAYLESLRHA